MKKLISKIFANSETFGAALQRARPRFVAEDFDAVYAVGDVHGCYETLLELEQRIISDGAAFAGRKLIVMLGDYVDRGSGSRQVLEHLIAPPPEGFERICLSGNHEAMFQNFLVDPKSSLGWLKMGGVETLFSYGIDANHLMQRGGVPALLEAMDHMVPASHRDFLESLCGLVVVGQVVFVHAGLRPGLEIDMQIDEDLMWIREPFLSEGPGLRCLVVHGHTPGPEPVIGPGRIGIDTGVCTTGKLTGLRVANGRVDFI